MNSSIKDIRLVDVPKIVDVNGNLSVIELESFPFQINSVRYLYNFADNDGENGNGYSHKNSQQLIIALSGSFDVLLKDGENEKTIYLNRPNSGLLISPGIWSALQNISSGAVCLLLSSSIFNEADFQRDFGQFRLSKNRIA